jgi:hypothetical protein
MTGIIDPFDSVQPRARIVDPFDNPDGGRSPGAEMKADVLGEAMSKMSWPERNARAAGAQLSKGWEGIRALLSDSEIARLSRMVTGGEQYQPDKRVLNEATRYAKEAPVGAFVGDVAKYAPAMAAGPAIIPGMVAAGTLGAAYEPGTPGERIQAGAIEGAASGAGGAALKGVSKLYGMGAANRAQDAVTKIIGPQNLDEAKRLITSAKGTNVTTEQALASLDDANIARLGDIAKAEVRHAKDPIAAAAERQMIEDSQAAVRDATMSSMAKGSTAENAAISRDLFSKMSAAELVPIRDSILGKMRQTGKTIDEILPLLSQKEAMYVSSLQNQGRMATEAAQQGVLRQGSRATERQVVNALPEGNFPRETSMPVSPAGTPSAAQMSDAPFAGRGSQADYAARVAQASSAADELGGVASKARTEADALRAQISALPSSFTAAPVRDAVAAAAARTVNPAEETVMNAVSKALQRAGDDPVAIAEVRKLGVNQIIGDLLATDKLSKTDAAAALASVKKLIDKQLGPEIVDRYFKPYSKKLEYRASLELADKLRALQKDSPSEFLKVMRGDNPDLVAKYGDWDSIKQALGDRRFGKASGVADEVARTQRNAELLTSKPAESAVNEILRSKEFTRHIPNFLNRYVMVANAAMKEGEMKVNRGMFREIEQAMRSPEAMEKLLNRLPVEQRKTMDAVIYNLAKGIKPSAVAGASTINTANKQEQ